MPLKGKQKGFIILTIVVIIFVLIGGSFTEATNYIYDDLHRLKKIKLDNGTVIEYEYDLIGNREREVINNFPVITVIPLSYDFGSVNVGTPSDKSFLVQNTGSADLVISLVNNPSLPFSILTENCSGQVLAVSETCSINVRFEPLSSDGFLHTDSFNIDSNDPDNGALTLNLSGTTHDLLPPTGAISSNNGDVYKASTSVTLNVSATSTKGIPEVCISNKTSGTSWQSS